MEWSILHAWSGYSLCRGTTPPERLAARAATAGYGALALTDVNALYGAPLFWPAARQAGLRPIVGAELRHGNTALVALVADGDGYESLCRIITEQIDHLQLTIDNFSKKGTSSLAGSSIVNCKSSIVNLSRRSIVDSSLILLTEDADIASALRSAGVPRERLWLELDPASQSRSAVARLTAASEALGIEPVATGRSLLLEQADRPAARVLSAIRQGKTIDTVAEEDLPPAGAVLRDVRTLAAQLAGFPRALDNNRQLADRCRYALLPRTPVFPDYDGPPGVAPIRHLRDLCERGIRWRYGRTTDAVARRLEHELRLIAAKGFAEYFLVVRDIVQYARRRHAPTAGRGSGASSLVAYVLGITNVCPLAFDIPFERFLHEQREDFPDLDLDFCWRVRDDVIDYAFTRWGKSRVAMVCTHNTFQPRSAFRETGKACGLSDAQLSRLPRAGSATHPNGPPIAALAQRLVGLPHLLSVHPGGIVIGRKPIDRYVPTELAAKGVRITQYDKDGVEAIGLVKLDLLGNRSISTITEACRWINRRQGDILPPGNELRIADFGLRIARHGEISLDAIPADDEATFTLLRNADTVGCNQLESPAMRRLLRAIQPRDTRDVMKALALVRPGAAGIGMKEAFVRRQRGLDPVPSIHPGVDALLAETHGVMLYEDDVMLVAAALLGLPRGAADRFRKAVQKCRDDAARRALSRDFLARCRANGVDKRLAGELWVQMAKFNAYSFCRAHAASYARLAYAAAWLKAHCPLEFWTAALNNNQSMYHPRVYVEQAKRAGIRFGLPDVNRSRAEFAIDDGAIRVGFSRVADLGPASVEKILAARAHRPFAGLSDFLDRTGLGVEEAAALVRCGAFDALGAGRAALMMELRLWRPCRAAHAGPQPVLLGACPAVSTALEDYPPARKLLDERAILGISVGEHPLSAWRPRLAGRTDADSRDLPARVGQCVRLAGLLEASRSVASPGGAHVHFLTLDDEFGLFEAAAPANRCRLLGRPDADARPAVVTGLVRRQYDVISLAAREVDWIGG